MPEDDATLPVTAAQPEPPTQWAIWREAWVPMLVMGWAFGDDHLVFDTEEEAERKTGELLLEHMPEARQWFRYEARPYRSETFIPAVEQPSLNGERRPFNAKRSYAEAVERILARKRAEQALIAETAKRRQRRLLS